MSLPVCLSIYRTRVPRSHETRDYMGTTYQPPGSTSVQRRQILLVLYEVDDGGRTTGKMDVLCRFVGEKGYSNYNGKCDDRDDFALVKGMIEDRMIEEAKLKHRSFRHRGESYW